MAERSTSLSSDSSSDDSVAEKAGEEDRSRQQQTVEPSVLQSKASSNDGIAKMAENGSLLGAAMAAEAQSCADKIANAIETTPVVENKFIGVNEALMNPVAGGHGKAGLEEGRRSVGDAKRSVGLDRSEAEVEAVHEEYPRQGGVMEAEVEAVDGPRDTIEYGGGSREMTDHKWRGEKDPEYFFMPGSNLPPVHLPFHPISPFAAASRGTDGEKKAKIGGRE